MLVLLIVVVRGVALVLRGHRELVLENVALRQQLAAMKRDQKRVPLNTGDRLSWIALAQCWRNWRTALVFVQPDTVVRWHRATGFAADGLGVPSVDLRAVHRSIRRFAISFERWHSASRSPSARCRVCSNRTHAHARRPGKRT